MANGDLDNEIRPWLESIFQKTLSIHVLGKSEKGDGYMGDIIFVRATEKAGKTYNLVLKCAKKSKTLRDSFPVQTAFFNEIFIYEKLLPSFLTFQKDKNVANPFESYPKCFGSFIGDNIEVIVLNNLKHGGYKLWPKKEPLSRKLIDLVVTEYGKFHAISVAFEEQQPQQFEELVSVIEENAKKFEELPFMEELFTAPFQESYELLKDELDEEILTKWRNFKKGLNDLFVNGIKEIEGLKVVLHGDCWNNNFMFLFDDYNVPQKVAFLDWQVSRYSSPILDLSYFLFACISESDLENVEDILVLYYDSFTRHLKNLGCGTPERVYPMAQLFHDWKIYSKFGIVMSALIMKIVSTDKDEVVDMADVVESGENFTHTFLSDIRDKENFKKRIKPIIVHVVKNNLI